jgi:hypothetical protein
MNPLHTHASPYLLADVRVALPGQQAGLFYS